MANVEEFHFERTNLDRIAGFHGGEHGFASSAVVPCQLDLDQAARETSCVYRDVDVVQNMVNGTNVIFMSMGDHDPHYLIGFLSQILVIGNDVINPEHIVLGKHDACIHNQDLVIDFVGSHVLAHFPEPT